MSLSSPASKRRIYSREFSDGRTDGRVIWQFTEILFSPLRLFAATAPSITPLSQVYAYSVVRPSFTPPVILVFFSIGFRDSDPYFMIPAIFDPEEESLPLSVPSSQPASDRSISFDWRPRSEMCDVGKERVSVGHFNAVTSTLILDLG